MITDADIQAAIAFVDALGFPQYAKLFQPLDMLGVHFDVADGGAVHAIEVIAAHREQARCDGRKQIIEKLETLQGFQTTIVVARIIRIIENLP